MARDELALSEARFYVLTGELKAQKENNCLAQAQNDELNEQRKRDVEKLAQAEQEALQLTKECLEKEMLLSTVLD